MNNTYEPQYRGQERRQERKRSRSPSHRYNAESNVKRPRAASHHREERDRDESRRHRPHHHRHHHHSSKHDSRDIETPSASILPFDAQHLHKRDNEANKALFARYLDVQKGLKLESLSEDEIKGRWKSFLGKWNRGELEERWYESALSKIEAGRDDEREAMPSPAGTDAGVLAVRSDNAARHGDGNDDDDEEDDDDYGPLPPAATPNPTGNNPKRPAGPANPTLDDLTYRNDLTTADRDLAISSLRHDRKLDRQTQQERLADLAPRADPGSRERQLEKKREMTTANNAFRDAKETGDVDVREADLMGADGAEEFGQELKRYQRKKTEKEIRKEEVLRARAEEREARLAVLRLKEEGTMGMLRGLAEARFGGGGGGG